MACPKYGYFDHKINLRNVRHCDDQHNEIVGLYQNNRNEWKLGEIIKYISFNRCFIVKNYTNFSPHK